MASQEVASAAQLAAGLGHPCSNMYALQVVSSHLERRGLVPEQGDERSERRQVQKIHSLQPFTPLTAAMGLLLESGASSLPVLDDVSPS